MNWAALETIPWFFPTAALVFGLLVGSFLNVVIYRLPIMMQRAWDAELQQWQAERDAKDGASAEDPAPELKVFNLSKPASTCPQCQHRIRAWENIPIISYLVLRGRCSQCEARISIRYPMVEALTGVLSLAVALRFGPGWEAVATIVFTWFLIAMSGIDIDHQLLPDSLTLSLLWIGLVLSLLTQADASVLFIEPRDAIVGAVIGYGVLWLVYQAFLLATGKQGMGFGDFKLLAALGAWLGWEALPMIILLSAVAGTVWGVLMIALKKQQQGQAMPFGPWLAIAGWLTLMFGQQISNWYLTTTGLAT
ncbi:MAG: A24 family peptidase [Pseudomonadota bacterium]